MSRIQWDETTMATGVDSIDGQHQELIRRLNRLIEAAEQGHGDQEIRQMLDFAESYARTHFSYEETLMDEVQSPVSEENKQQHAMFLEDFFVLREKFEAEGSSPLFITIVEHKLLNWLALHICKCDVHLRETVHTADSFQPLSAGERAGEG